MCIPERSEMDLLMIKWCIYLCHLSSKAYDTLRQSGVVYLPSRRTLRDYTHYIPAQSGSVTQSKIHPLATGFSSAVHNMLFQSVNIPSCAERERDGSSYLWMRCTLVCITCSIMAHVYTLVCASCRDSHWFH